jgi:putative resolvase
VKLSEYARRNSVTYRTAWNRYKAGKIEGAYADEYGFIHVPEGVVVDLNKAAIYARVSDPRKRKDQLLTQEQRMQNWAVANGYQVVESVREVGSGVNDKREALAALLKRDTWGTLIVEHKDRLTRFGFRWFELFVTAQGRRIVVVNEAAEGTDDLIHDLVAIIYSFSAGLYGQRRSPRAQELSRLAREPMDVDELDDDGTESS